MKTSNQQIRTMGFLPLLALIIGFSSCEKETIEPVSNSSKYSAEKGNLVQFHRVNKSIITVSKTSPSVPVEPSRPNPPSREEKSGNTVVR